MDRDATLFVDGIGLDELVAKVSAASGLELEKAVNSLGREFLQGQAAGGPRITVIPYAARTDEDGLDLTSYPLRVGIDDRNHGRRIQVATSLYSELTAQGARALLLDDDEGVLARSDAA